MQIVALISCILGTLLVLADPPGPSWITLNMTVPKQMTDTDYVYTEVPVLVGSPPQTVSMTVNIAGDFLAAWSTDCVFCPGYTPFDPQLSSTFSNENKNWPHSDSQMSGVSDIFNFGGILNASRNEFFLIDDMPTGVGPRYRNGHFGVMVSQNASQREQNIFSRMWETNRILNPVVAFRFDPKHPKMTIGALDPNDYEGEINWVQMESADTAWDLRSVVKIDGIKGANGSLLPYGDLPLAGLSSFSRNILVPNTTPYVFDENMTGKNVSGTIYLWTEALAAGFGYDCTLSPLNDSGSAPYIDITVCINGVDYKLDSKDNMIRPPSMLSKQNVCNVAINNRTSMAAPAIVLGLPFLRSVYVAYRFPTGDCPGYYGFAFPSGLNRTEAQKAQKPRATPTSASKCLNLIRPTTTPLPLPVALVRGRKMSPSSYSVFKHKEEGQVPLIGWDELPKGKYHYAFGITNFINSSRTSE